MIIKEVEPPEDREGLIYFLNKTIVVLPKVQKDEIKLPKNKRKSGPA